MKRAVTLEQFFTPIDTAQQCVELVRDLIDLTHVELYVEPSAGDGVFFELLPPGQRVGIDIEPRHPEIVRSDFFDWRCELPPERVLIIGNPPFGQRGALAMKFLNYALTLADTVAFIVPRSFQKFTFLNRVSTTHELVAMQPLVVPYRTDKGTTVVNTVFQVWRRGVEPRPLIERSTHHVDFDMRHAHLSRISDEERYELVQWADFAIAQVGANFSPKDVSDVRKGSHWFIKSRSPEVREIFEEANYDFLAGHNVAHTSLAKADIVAAYEEARKRR